MSLCAFHLGQIISTVLGQVDYDGQHGNVARIRNRDETSESDHTLKRRFRHGAFCRTIKDMDILRCLCGWSLGSVKLLLLIFQEKMVMAHS